LPYCQSIEFPSGLVPVKRLIDTVVHKITFLHTIAYPADLTPDNRDNTPIDKRVGESKTPDENEIQLIAKESPERMSWSRGQDCRGPIGDQRRESKWRRQGAARKGSERKGGRRHPILGWSSAGWPNSLSGF
jgi:hypothetical protein